MHQNGYNTLMAMTASICVWWHRLNAEEFERKFGSNGVNEALNNMTALSCFSHGSLAGVQTHINICQSFMCVCLELCFKFSVVLKGCQLVILICQLFWSN